MTVPSFYFLLFAAVAASILALSKAQAWRDLVMLAVNLGFIWTFCRTITDLVPYFGFLIASLAVIRLIGHKAGASVRVASICIILIGFCWLKRYAFIPDITYLEAGYVTVGLSYVFFRVMHLAIIANEEDRVARIGIVDYLNYTLNFTSLVSGPIQNFDEHYEMTHEDRARLTIDDVGHAVYRIITGMFYFSVLASIVTFVQRTAALELPHDPSKSHQILPIVVLTAAYPVFLFFNFAGYTSFVIGVARFFRIKLPENFDQPFRSASFMEYWSRWHMSLSNWLKANVYNPIVLAAARRVSDRSLMPYISIGALFVTFFLIGIWHGRSWHFFTFGLLNGAGVAVNQLYRLQIQRRLGSAGYQALVKNDIYLFVGRGLTFAWVAFTLLWFWSDWPELGDFADRLGASGMAVAAGALIVGGGVVIGMMLALRALAGRMIYGGRPVIASAYVRTVWATLMVLAIIAFNVAQTGDAGNVVYKDF